MMSEVIEKVEEDRTQYQGNLHHIFEQKCLFTVLFLSPSSSLKHSQPNLTSIFKTLVVLPHGV